ncbi:hypothetical protein BT69DRAFT_1290186 [Atractiella rhizophila]|nr:hypothetical protein BT69DRAFT_1290186 [Atractiella rhizophila]
MMSKPLTTLLFSLLLVVPTFPSPLFHERRGLVIRQESTTSNAGLAPGGETSSEAAPPTTSDNPPPSTTTTTDSSAPTDGGTPPDNSCFQCSDSNPNRPDPCNCADWSPAPGNTCSGGAGGADSDGKPTVCIGGGGTPSSLQCVQNCNGFINTAQGPNVCNQNHVNAARTCATCNANAWFFTVRPDGQTAENSIYNFDSYIAGLQTYCLAAPRCYNVQANAPVTTGACAVANPPGGGGGTTTNTPPGGGGGGGATTTAGGGGISTSPVGGSSNADSQGVSTLPSSNPSNPSANPSSNPNPSNPLSPRPSATDANGNPVPSQTVTSVSTTDSQGRPTVIVIPISTTTGRVTNTQFGTNPTSNGSNGSGALSMKALDTSRIACTVAVAFFVLIWCWM